MLSARQISCQLAGTTGAKLLDSFEAVENAVRKIYPNAHRQGAAGGWSWVDDAGVVVAASNHVLRPPFGRHWLAIRPKG